MIDSMIINSIINDVVLKPLLLTDCTHSSCVYIVDFEQIRSLKKLG